MKIENGTITLSTSELKNFLAKGIEHYQGNPAKKLNKLNESMAKGLNFKSYDALAPLLVEPAKSKFTIEIDDDNNSFINGKLINPEFFDEEKVSYKIRTKDEVVEFIFECLSNPIDTDRYEHEMKQRQMMIDDIKLLQSSAFENDEFILTSIETNKYLSAHHGVSEFNEFCSDTLELNKEFSELPRCEHCSQNLTEDDSVCREYYSKDDDDSVSIIGKYETKDCYFESKEGLPHGNYDYGDDSDTCTNCGHIVG